VAEAGDVARGSCFAVLSMWRGWKTVGMTASSRSLLVLIASLYVGVMSALYYVLSVGHR
jgi:hypothetical protein